MALFAQPCRVLVKMRSTLNRLQTGVFWIPSTVEICTNSALYVVSNTSQQTAGPKVAFTIENLMFTSSVFRFIRLRVKPINSASSFFSYTIRTSLFGLKRLKYLFQLLPTRPIYIYCYSKDSWVCQNSGCSLQVKK